MKITNYDAPENLVEKFRILSIPSFIREVVRPLESELDQIDLINGCPTSNQIITPQPVRMFNSEMYENVANLLHTIPIYLRSDRTEGVEDDIVDLLGGYFKGRNGETPYIELYLSSINNSTNENDIFFKWLVTKVLLHELSHAALDIFNCEYKQNRIEKVSYNTQFGKWREESMSNAISLRIIKEYGNKEFYDYAKQFMRSQDPEYALGVLMEDFGYWDFRSVFDSKEQGVDDALKGLWLQYVQGNPEWNGLKEWNELLNSEYVYCYKGQYYKDARDLVPVIVGDILAEYEKNNGKKMSYSEFASIFPYMKTGAEMSYEPFDKVQEDSRFSQSFTLLDGKYSLYYFWDNNSLHQFVANTKVQFDEYKNY